MSTEEKTKHNGIEEAKKQNKSSHGNEVKYFTHRNAAISVFSVLKLRKKYFSFGQQLKKILTILYQHKIRFSTSYLTCKQPFFGNETEWTQRLLNIQTFEQLERVVDASTEVAILIA